MLSKIIQFSIKNKLIIGIFTLIWIGFGVFSMTQLSVGAVPDITNNQVQVITTSHNLSTEDIEQFITYPIELEMANVPGVIEIRSISRFGLSVVTIVFEESMGAYLPRQLVAEKIQSAAEKIPPGFGTPEMAPMTSGLGEIYHYTLEVKPEFKNNYSLTDLRDIQDWVIKRQLNGIPGVVEVNTWGGHLKQYEVAINTHRLKAMNISIQEVYAALEKNNSLSGGGYIERENQAYFIRGEGLVKTLEDIEEIVVKNNQGHPMYIRDIATVHYGKALRFGAITGNGEGEKIMGQILMLKGADSHEVIHAVKERIDQVSENLPEGVSINPFLDRSELIDKTTATVAENVVLGILIVIFVVVLLFGNLRSGFVVASVIPLSLLFTLSMMYVFKLDVNLMSMGAIDFGIIIDGAVIIVEFVAFQIVRNSNKLQAVSESKQQEIKDEITGKSASTMMNAAVFGQLIILIVFIPILSLGGVEGKMFRPMALTFSFALIGAMILCFTYVPMAAALFLKAEKPSNKNISVRIMKFFYRIYDPIIHWALRSKKMVLGIAILALVITGFVFSTMGSEFVPSLDEGDFVIQPVLRTGTTLSNTIEITTKMEKILIEQFPEVNQVVSRIGAAEVPTDPMAMEESDVVITLKPMKQWTSAKTKNELADKMKEALEVIPGMEVEFTQPIEMRFNELITGVRADIAIKVFGEDMDILAEKASEIQSLIEHVNGADDIIVEKVVGLPEMNVKFNRRKIAQYGLNIQEVNDIIAMGFAGKTLGNVYEGERRYNLVLRLDENYRKDISGLENLYVDTPAGAKIPLRELAEIKYTKGAAQISRDDTKRRIVVGVNVRNRDLQSVVDDIQTLIHDNITLPTGYYIDYGGQFENLRSAKNRLMIAVPVALLLIFILLYFAFHSIKKAIIIFSVIPLATVGGVFSLWIRDMPFSISAGVGFIALFGLAVLNGIVLIEHFKELKEAGMNDSKQRIIRGTKDRLRAVIMTASAAALGFLPMAVSTNVGAEVQRPLATVVIGGLISATILTLVVLPVLYSIFEGNWRKRRKLKVKKEILSVLLILTGFFGFAQEKHSLSDLQQMAQENNAGFRATMLEVEENKMVIGEAFTLDKTHIYYEYDENNIAPNNLPLKVFGAEQEILFPTVYFSKRKLNTHRFTMKTHELELKRLELNGEVAAAYNVFLLEKKKERIYIKLDSLFRSFSHAANRRFELGETNYLEKITAQAKQKQVQTDLFRSREDVEIALKKLKSLVQSKNEINPEVISLDRMEIALKQDHPILEYVQTEIEYFKAKHSLEKQEFLPDLTMSYGIGTNSGLEKNLNVYQFGIKIPLIFGGRAHKMKAAKIAVEIAESTAEDAVLQLNSKREILLQRLVKYEENLKYYEDEGKLLSQQILKTANLSFQNGEIDFFQYIQSLETVYEIELKYLESLNEYNQTVLSINYLTF